ncbi:MAG: SDR family oxidoreductase [Gemmatimonadetes bacterium]|nr:SDR family oxidoreductase [Gemmatimonadota bacterium]
MDRTVVITGASRGLGEALARTFARAGARLVLGARDVARLETVAHECGGDTIARACDVREPTQLRALVATAVERFGSLDVMINNAGFSVYGPLLDTKEADFDEMLATNVKGVYFGCQAALRVMREAGRGLIVNVSSIAGARHLPNESAYGATKWAVQGLTGVLQQEAAAFGVRVTSLVAGGIATPFWDGREYVPFPRERLDPARDFMDPAEVAEVVLDVARKSDRFVMPEVMCLPLIR